MFPPEFHEPWVVRVASNPVKTTEAEQRRVDRRLTELTLIRRMLVPSN
jgi:hypothetical protein